MPHRAHIAEPEASSSLKLSLVNGHNAAAEYFRDVCAGVYTERENTDQNAVLRGNKDKEIGNHQLNHNGSSANNRQIDFAYSVQKSHKEATRAALFLQIFLILVV